jgi:hypothetical protein
MLIKDWEYWEDKLSMGHMALFINPDNTGLIKYVHTELDENINFQIRYQSTFLIFPWNSFIHLRFLVLFYYSFDHRFSRFAEQRAPRRCSLQ